MFSLCLSLVSCRFIKNTFILEKWQKKYLNIQSVEISKESESLSWESYWFENINIFHFHANFIRYPKDIKIESLYHTFYV